MTSSRLLAPVLLLAACGDDGGSSTTEGTYDQPLFAVASTVSTADSSLTYVNLVGDLGVQTLDYDLALEYPGWTTALGVEGKLFIANGEAPTVERFDVDDDHRITADGSIGFSNFTDSVAFFSHIYANPERGYFQLGAVDLVSWNPRAMTVGDAIEAPAGIPATREGLGVYGSYDRGVAVRDGTIFQPIYWVDDDFYSFASTSQIAIYDVATDRATGLIEAPCPNLDIAATDEQGNIWFSNWVYSAAKPLFDKTAPEPCMVKVAAGTQTVDESATIDFPAMTGGRQAAAFRYLANGKGLLTVFHDERMDPKVDPFDAVFSTNWKFWMVDLATKTAEPLEGLDYVAPGYYLFRIDGKTYLNVPNEDLSETIVYEISDAGVVTKLFTTRGWAYQLLKIR